jgi:oligopeptide transport system ATP-binding protein
VTSLLRVDDLAISFRAAHGVVRAVDGLSFSVSAGETLGIVGESGSGKSVTQLALLGLLPSPPARVERGTGVFDGVDLLQLRDAELRRIRGARIAMIFQDPMTSLNPFLTVQRQLTEVLAAHTDLDRAAQRARVLDMLGQVGIPDPEARLRAYPHELSGGMRQRVMIAMALLCAPALLVADEPTTALDVTIQAQILELLSGLARQRQTAILLITHDLGVVAGRTDRTMVMYAGRAMETAPTAALFANPAHPYTAGLLRSVPRLDRGDAPLVPIPGAPPDTSAPIVGCPFAPRCGFATAQCNAERPQPRPVDGDAAHVVSCHRPEVRAWLAEGLTSAPA